MIRASDFLASTASAAALARAAGPVAPRANDAVRGAAWFGAERAGASIVADLPAQARGLSVEQHAERVLAGLLGGRDERA